MTTYWCANFDAQACLDHGIENNLWMMQYQYADDHGNEHQSYKPGRISANWRQMANVSPGDWFVAYVPRKRSISGNPFYAIGKVRTPRRPRTANDVSNKIEEYLAERRSHDQKHGYVYYTDARVFYENFDDKWIDPEDDNSRYAQRIDVEKWELYAPDGVWVAGAEITQRKKTVYAVFEIGKDYFEAIREKLTSAKMVFSNDDVAQTVEKTQAKRQGFLLDSKLRKALEEYAMDAAKRYFKSLGYVVEDHSQGHPYDFLCTRKTKRLYVEVKGTQTNGEGIVLTSGEVEFARRHKEQMALFIRHSIKVSAGVLSNGENRVICPWDVDRGILKPISYWYELPNGAG